MAEHSYELAGSKRSGHVIPGLLGSVTGFCALVLWHGLKSMDAFEKLGERLGESTRQLPSTLLLNMLPCYAD